jgi:hypothetical protein
MSRESPASSVFYFAAGSWICARSWMGVGVGAGGAGLAWAAVGSTAFSHFDLLGAEKVSTGG